MKIRRALAALFVAGALSLALVPVEPQSSGSLLAQQLTQCGGFEGPLCKKQINCVWVRFFGRLCTEYYYYYPPPKDDQKGNEDLDDIV